MAFPRADTDRLYEDTICRALVHHGITPIRIDRLDHNDDIDDRMMREIRNATCMIADLTYARPSVYYEAGFAEREIPVIYTVRSDHFVLQAEDIFGNLRVHFDLSMKNVISWNDPDDLVFLKRLEDRIDLILRPIRQSLSSDRERARQAAAFQEISSNERDCAIESAASALLKKHGYLDLEAIKNAGFHGSDSWDRKGSPVNRSEWYRPGEDIYRFVRLDLSISPSDSFSVPDVSNPRYNLNVGFSVGKYDRLNEFWILVSYEKLNLSLVRERLKDFKKISGANVFMLTLEASIPSLDGAVLGDVFLWSDYVDEKVGLATRLWSGRKSNYRRGFRTNPPRLDYRIYMSPPLPIISSYMRGFVRDK